MHCLSIVHIIESLYPHSPQSYWELHVVISVQFLWISFEVKIMNMLETIQKVFLKEAKVKLKKEKKNLIHKQKWKNKNKRRMFCMLCWWLSIKKALNITQFWIWDHHLVSFYGSHNIPDKVFLLSLIMETISKICVEVRCKSIALSKYWMHNLLGFFNIYLWIYLYIY